MKQGRRGPMSHLRALGRLASTAIGRVLNIFAYLFRRGEVDINIYPSDAGAGSVAGPDPERVLLIGEAAAAGVGTVTHELGIAATFARGFAAATGHGVHWSLRRLPDFRLRSAIGCLPPEEILAATDVVIVMAGMADVLMLTPQRAWGQQLEALLYVLDRAMSSDGRVVLAELPPMDNIAFMPPIARRAAGRQGMAFNRIAREIVARYERALFAPFPAKLAAVRWEPSHASSFADLYATWGESLVVADIARLRSWGSPLLQPGDPDFPPPGDGTDHPRG